MQAEAQHAGGITRPGQRVGHLEAVLRGAETDIEMVMQLRLCSKRQPQKTEQVQPVIRLHRIERAIQLIIDGMLTAKAAKAAK